MREEDFEGERKEISKNTFVEKGSHRSHALWIKNFVIKKQTGKCYLARWKGGNDLHHDSVWSCLPERSREVKEEGDATLPSPPLT